MGFNPSYVLLRPIGRAKHVPLTLTYSNDRAKIEGLLDFKISLLVSYACNFKRNRAGAVFNHPCKRFLCNFCPGWYFLQSYSTKSTQMIAQTPGV